MITIDELILRIPGIDEGRGHALAHEISNQLLEKIPAPLSDLHIGQINLQLKVEGNVGIKQMADSISQQIVERINPDHS